MKKYFIDFEFSEGFHKPISFLPALGFNKPRWSIEMISVGIKCDDGRSYYAVNDSFSRSRCNDWVKEHVLPKLPPMYEKVPASSVGVLIAGSKFWWKNPVYRSPKLIAGEIYAFVNDIAICPVDTEAPNVQSFLSELEKRDYNAFCDWFISNSATSDEEGRTYARPQFYGFYAAYDWVLFCIQYGGMNDLPKGFPMYCHDLKSMLDEEVMKIVDGMDHNVTAPYKMELFEKVLGAVRGIDIYPRQKNEHNAMDDALFNEKIFEVIKYLRTKKIAYIPERKAVEELPEVEPQHNFYGGGQRPCAWQEG